MFGVFVVIDILIVNFLWTFADFFPDFSNSSVDKWGGIAAEVAKLQFLWQREETSESRRLKLKSRTEGVTQTQQARYLRITISQKLNVPTHCLQEGHPLNPETKGEDKNSREWTS